MTLNPTDEKRPLSNYQAYMLRLWHEGDDLPWRASLQNPHTGEQQHFAALTQLFAYLEQQTRRDEG